MAVLNNREVQEMTEKEKGKKLKELRKELIKQNVASEDKIKPKEIKKAIARLMTSLNNTETRQEAKSAKSSGRS